MIAKLNDNVTIFPNLFKDEESNHIIDALIKEDPSEQSYCFCYCGHSMAEHQDANRHCFNCNCNQYIAEEGGFV